MQMQLAKLAVLGLTISLSITSANAAVQAKPWPRHAQPELTQAASDELARLNAAAHQPFKAEASRVTGAARTISGGSFAPDQNLGAAASQSGNSGAVVTSHEQAAVSFLRDHATLFALPSNLAMHTLVRGELEPRVYVSYELMGMAVEGVDATVLFDKLGNITGVAVDAPRNAQITGSFDLGETQARAAARASIDAYRSRRGHTQAIAWREPVMTMVYIPAERGLTAAYRAELDALAGAESYVACVDAQTGASLRLVDRVYHATGHYPNFVGNYPSMLNFSTSTANGYVYKNQADSINEHRTKKDLKNWSKGIGAPFDLVKGWLTGARIDVYDANNDNAFAANGKFNFSPTDEAQAHLFDQVNIYYQLETFYGHLKSVLGTDLGSNFSIPVIVNIPSNEINAFFSSSLAPDGFGHSNGFMAFFDLSETNGPAADVARDPVAVHHEYTHCWIHFQGESFEDPGDYPTRAVGEAIPDFYASTYAKDTQVGRYIAEFFPDQGFPRDLQDDDHFPETTQDSIAITGDLPEEHRNGEIFGSFLTDLRLEIGATDSEKLVFKALPLMPNSMISLNWDVVTSNVAEQATGEYFAECVKALADSTTSVTKLGAILGAATGRGIIGTYDAWVDFIVALEPLSKRKISYPSRFVVDDVQGYLFTAKPGRKLTVTIKAASGSDVLPDFEIESYNQLANPITTTSAKTFSSGGHKVEQKNIQLNLPSTEPYVIIISTQAGELGRYTLTLDA